MKRARIFHEGRTVWADVSEDGAMLFYGAEKIRAENARWLPPIAPGAAIFALGLNYADHNRELGFKAEQPKPLIFLKGHAALLGHEGATPRPADADQMHPECELVAVIGRPARRVKRQAALDFVSGYTIANDYAIRDYLENFYRPNARVKNRDATTPMGPWIVDAETVGDPQALVLQTRINGEIAQSGCTADMLLSIAELIEYLSDIMTLSPGDMILSGTPHGVGFVQPGDKVECEIDKIGTLINYVKAAA